MRHIWDDGRRGRRGGGGGDRSRVSTGAEREQIAFQPCCSLPIHNADRKPVDNGGPVEESSALVAIKLLFGHPLCLLFPPPRSPPPQSPLYLALRIPVILTTRQDVHTGRYNRECGRNRERERESLFFSFPLPLHPIATSFLLSLLRPSGPLIPRA